MSQITDHEAMRRDILLAFQKCIDEKPLGAVTLRDIADKAHMSHPKLLYYFKNKHELVLAYVRFTRDYMTEKCVAWFSEHPRPAYKTNLDYMNAFMSYVAEGQAGEQRPNATTQTYVLAHYDAEVAELVMAEFAQWRQVMESCLVDIYGPEVGSKEAEAMMILIAGTFICSYNRALTGAINDNIIGYIANLTK